MNNFFGKILLKFLCSEIIIVDGYYRESSAEAIFQVFKQSGKRIKKVDANFCSIFKKIFYKGIIVIPAIEEELLNMLKIIPNKKIKTIIFNSTKELPEDYSTPASSRSFEIAKSILGKKAHKNIFLINVDDNELKRVANSGSLTFGFDEKARLQASNIMIGGEGTNFKLNFEGKVIPVWLNKTFGREQIYASLVAIGTAFIFGINPLEASQNLKFYKPLPGKMNLIEGIKRSWILDDSENASLSTMIEAIDVINKITSFQFESFNGRKVAVLGDIIGLEEYTAEIHEKIGDKVAEVFDVLFTIGPRAKFIAQGAINSGFPKENIYTYLDVDAAKLDIQAKMKEKDLILIDGAAELEMGKVVEEIERL